ncbi:MAG: 2-oxoacid:acceptor oxidoreductase subunit alpha [Candidatus Marinimicrobia bacterium]|nr:2-oxoacid:acceptor oxidoreductase subunit alpha [Candidatus Neomarinimicrobiota bacterium]MBT5955439.1 2-oxoacid:acceptor oxidoreductase subunit alpha [Candidatus Neomarinimicrobiota bacterium]MBT6869864.1 2-oxoacid:acceptor oxidoreductase subunit alpha [Candidatus Neomarinimicrobiota bacterium]MBT7376619.1 2-oxoacid:acceptor oxidoreductase subunit alpha [Candidatus Neomarinimicrobiota bacterium]
MSDQNKTVEELDVVTIRFAGDSGDGMQLTGTQFTDNTALFGNDLSTLPDYPAEIRAPAGSLAGVSSFQLQFSNQEIHTPGDDLDVLVAMNPAALKVHLADLQENGMVMVNTANFSKKNLKLAGYEVSPLEDNTFDNYRLIEVDMTKLVATALENLDMSPKLKARSTNMFALGLLYWLYERDMDSSINFITKKFAKKPEIITANVKALKTGYFYGETIEAIKTTYRVPKAEFSKGTYRNIMGNHAAALGLVAAAEKAGLNLFYGGYPITPASDILHYLANFKNFGIKTFQAEDEIAGVCSAIGASFAGDLAVTASSGPGIALKGEALGLAVMTELPLVVINVQRGGPSTGLPTKTEQSDLFQAMYGRNGECPMVVVAPATPSDCFNVLFEACKIALEHMIPVMVLSDGYVANGSEPWMIPTVDDLPQIKVTKATDPESFMPYSHAEGTVARPWAVPGTPGLEHRIGGLEKEDQTGNVNYDPDNHHYMNLHRQNKVDAIANYIPEAKAYGDDSGELLVLGWGGTHGAIRSSVERAQKAGHSVSHLHLRHINPFPKNLGEVLSNYKKVLIPELNLGQLSTMIRAKFLVDAQGLNKVAGKPFTTTEVYNKILQMVKG